ncbi:MAG TPA: hypothetical protein VII23_14235, partial [Terriglobales bacterium]
SERDHQRGSAILCFNPVPLYASSYKGLLKLGGSHTAIVSTLASLAQGVDRSMVQFGKGFLLDVLKSPIS